MTSQGKLQGLGGQEFQEQKKGIKTSWEKDSENIIEEEETKGTQSKRLPKLRNSNPGRCPAVNPSSFNLDLENNLRLLQLLSAMTFTRWYQYY